MATATTAPTRPKIDTFLTRKIEIESAGIVLQVEGKDSGGTTTQTFGVGIQTNAARRLVYNAAGAPEIENAAALTIAGIMSSVLTTFVGASGTVANRMLAVDTLLQSNGIIPA